MIFLKSVLYENSRRDRLRRLGAGFHKKSLQRKAAKETLPVVHSLSDLPITTTVHGIKFCLMSHVNHPSQSTGLRVVVYHDSPNRYGHKLEILRVPSDTTDVAVLLEEVVETLNGVVYGDSFQAAEELGNLFEQQMM